MPYKCIARYPIFKGVKNFESVVVPQDLRCDGCAEHCLISMRPNIQSNYDRATGKQRFFIDFAMCASDVKLFGLGTVCADAKMFERNVTLEVGYAKRKYQKALNICRKTCVHSKCI